MSPIGYPDPAGPTGPESSHEALETPADPPHRRLPGRRWSVDLQEPEEDGSLSVVSWLHLPFPRFLHWTREGDAFFHFFLRNILVQNIQIMYCQNDLDILFITWNNSSRLEWPVPDFTIKQEWFKELMPRFFNNDISLVPKMALTVGVGTVMDAREVVIVITGAHKALALANCIEQGVNHMYTVSALQMHTHPMIVCDDDATLELKVKTVKVGPV